MYKNKILILALIILNISHIFCSEYVATTTANFLKIPVSARAAALAEAYTAVSCDVYSIHFNPAGIARIKNNGLSFSHTSWVESINYEYLAYAYKLNNFSSIGFSVGFLFTGEIEKFGIDTSGIVEDVLYTNQKYSSFDFIFNICYANKFKNMYLGETIKFISSKIEETSSQSIALDIGYIYEISNLTSLGLTVKNLGLRMKFNQKTYELPIEFKLGLSHKVLSDKLLISFDLCRANDKDLTSSIGFEYKYEIDKKTILFPRLGYKTNPPDLGSFSGFSLGIGVKTKNFVIDYSLNLMNLFGEIHRISLGIEFYNR